MILGKETEFLNKMAERKLVSEKALYLSEFLTQLEKNLLPEEKTVFAAAVSLISNKIAEGSLCLTEDDVEEFVKNNGDLCESVNFLGFQGIKEVLAKSSCCTENPGTEAKPLVVYGDKIYFYKYWLYENSFASKTAEISKESGRYVDFAGKIEEKFDKLFDAASSEQHEAAKTAVKNRFSLITGGPGTGKTTIVAKILVGISSLFPEERILLAAPTGKASARMTEALKEAVLKIREKSDAVQNGVLDKISRLEGTTIHRMLEWKFGRFSRNHENPLAADLVIIDEAGMLDITLFTSLLDALGKETSLILLGDKDQLASVGAGNVLADIYSAAEKNLLPQKIVAKLETSHRSCPGIINLAKAVNEQKKVKEVIEVCNSENECGWVEIQNEKLPKSILSEAAKKYEFLFNKESEPGDILKKLNDFKVLVPSKEDAFGVTELNRQIEAELGKTSENSFYDGMPVMVTQNDYTNGLMNGDCGVILEREGRKLAWFMVDNKPKSFVISSLNNFETVYAMTVHKSQGSEYKSVLVVLPKDEMPLLTKQLLYTAVTRAKEEVKIAAKESVLKYTLQKNTARNSGFEEALGKRNP